MIESILKINKKFKSGINVVYSRNNKNPLSGYGSGINSHGVNAISMDNKDGYKIFNDIIEKIKKHQRLYISNVDVFYNGDP